MNAYVVGVPGSGKSTLLRHLTAGLASVPQRYPFAHAVYLDRARRLFAVQLGAIHHTFPGTDRLSMSVGPTACAWVRHLADVDPELHIVGEGDRLAYGAFLDALGGHLVWLDVPDAVAWERRAARGHLANESWLAGRRTKVTRLVRDRPHVRLDGTLSPTELAEAAREAVPAFAALAAAT